MKELKMVDYVKCPKEGNQLVIGVNCGTCDHNWWVDYGERIVYCKYGMTKEELIDEGVVYS
ncbi:MAG: hypothetical protein WC319_15490 [Candidatus Paceibacterota bacterium]|jgi:hypothetical protein